MVEKISRHDGGIPANFKPVYSVKEISDAVSRVGADIDTWAQDIWATSHTDIIAIPILRGGIFFFADLVRSLKHSVELAPVQTWAYIEDGVISNQIKVDISQVPAKGRAVLLIDDICDSGKTLKVLCEELLKAGARVVKTAVLIRRVRSDASYLPDWSAFHYEGAEWMVGYGMDSNGRWRNLADIQVIGQDASGEKTIAFNGQNCVDK